MSRVSLSIVDGENVYLGEEDSKGFDTKEKKAYEVLHAFLVAKVPMDANNMRIDLANPLQLQAFVDAIQSEDLNKKIKSANTPGTSWNRLVAIARRVEDDLCDRRHTKGNLQIKAIHEDGKGELAAHKFLRESFAKIKKDGLAGLRVLFPSAPDEDLKKMEGQLDEVVKMLEIRVCLWARVARSQGGGRPEARPPIDRKGQDRS